MERKIETKIVTALMFSQSGNLKLGSNPRVRIYSVSPPLAIENDRYGKILFQNMKVHVYLHVIDK